MPHRKLVLLTFVLYSTFATSAFAQQAAPGIAAGRIVETRIENVRGSWRRMKTVYTKWASRFAVNMIEENKQNLSKLRGIFIDYGEKEEFPHIRLGARLFSSALAERNIPHIFEVYEAGNHGNKIRQRLETRVFEFFSARLDFGH